MEFFLSKELAIFAAMIATFIICSILLKMPTGLSMGAAAIVGALIGGYGIPLRHLVEGMFSYVDTILIIATAMIFMKVIELSGALDAISSLIMEKFHTRPALLLVLIMIVIMFPAMITGSSTASVLSTGTMMAPVLMLMGIPPVETACILIFGAIYGMIAPPVNIMAMIIGGGIDIPYVGFELPLTLLTIPPAIILVIKFGYKYAKDLNYQDIKPQLNNTIREKHGAKIYLPIIIAIILIVFTKLIPIIPDLRTPLIFLISAFVGLFTGEKINAIEASKEAVNSVLGVMAILMGVGMFIQIMTLTGVRGYIVSIALSIPEVLRYLAIGLSIPAFGAVSAYGSASVLGVPFLLSLMNQNTVVTAAALSLISGVGDLVPPTDIIGIFAARAVNGENQYSVILRKCIVPGIITIAWALIIIVLSNYIGPILGV